MNRLSGFALLCGLVLVLHAGSTAHAAAGRTSGSFTVTQNGAASYTIPIWAPPGPRGLQPNLALTYNSQQGGGPLGVGWSLRGLGSIYRCNRTYAQDTTPAPVSLSTTDGYCLNGNRLRLTGGTYGVAGSTYQAEIAEFSKVTAIGSVGNGPAYFTVQGKDGSTYEYGNGGNSQVLANGATASAWLLDKVTDRGHNTMAITYNPPSSTLSGATNPAAISWTPSSSGSSTYNYTMEFGYTSNVPQSSILGYVAGSLVLNEDLLLTITIKNGTPIKQYVLNYDTSSTTGAKRLVQVKECADTAQANCLLPTSIAYQPGQAGLSSAAVTPVGTGARTEYNHYDLNGDGYPDLIWNDQNFTTTFVAFGSATGYGSAVNAGIASNNLIIGDLLGTGKDGLIADHGGTLWYYTWNGSSFAGVSTGVASAHAITLADVNGDGLPDLVFQQGITANGFFTFHVMTRLNTSSNGVVSFSPTVNDSVMTTCICNAGVLSPNFGDMGQLRAWDFNGDGRQDLAMVIYLSSGAQSISQLIANGTNFAAVNAASSSSGSAWKR